jgi:hypothetical protein
LPDGPLRTSLRKSYLKTDPELATPEEKNLCQHLQTLLDTAASSRRRARRLDDGTRGLKPPSGPLTVGPHAHGDRRTTQRVDIRWPSKRSTPTVAHEAHPLLAGGP